MSYSNGVLRCRVIYDFQAQPNSGELDIYTNEILTVTRQDVGEGWWEGCNSRGESGLFPAGYVEMINPPPPPPLAAAATIKSTLPPQPMSPMSPQMTSQSFSMPSPGYPPPPGPDNDQNEDWADDDWDDDDSDNTTADQMHGQGYNVGTLPANSTLSVSSGPQKASQAKKGINRLTFFAKSGGEDFILGSKTKNVPSGAFVQIIETSNNEIMWAPSRAQYTCAITAPRKETKLKGFKTFTAYKITPSFNNIVVSRRYKHFDWLYGRLEDKFMTIPIPWLPAKQISGRFDEQFIEHRKIQLQMWINRICRHPVMAQCDVWMHFITCTDSKIWKNGKRRAEKDEFTGGSFFYTLQTPNVPLEVSFVESKTESFGKFISKMDQAIKNLSDVATDQSKKYTGAYKREMQKIGFVINNLATAYDHSDFMDQRFNEALRGTASTFEKIAKMYEEQPKNDFEPLTYILYEYRGFLSAWPEILDLNKQALSRKKDFIKGRDEGKVEDKIAESVSQRADVVSYAVLAEINHFQNERVKDSRDMMKMFLQAQLNFYQGIVNQLQDALNMYN